MSDGFDLRERPWIPVRTAEGSARQVGLRELFHQAHLIEDVEVTVPPAGSALLRVLVAMTARIARVGGVEGERLDDPDVAEDADAWCALRDRVLAQQRFDPEVVDAYLDVEVPAGRFDLFDAERPFLQDPRLAAQCTTPAGEPNPSGVNKLVLGRPTGVNGAVLFGHFTDADPVPIPADEAAWHLLAQLYYGPSGQCTPRRITQTRAGSGDAGPLRKTVSFHPWAPTLFASLLLGVPRWRDGEDLDAVDQCPWEEDDLPDPLGAPTPMTWPGRLLTGRARHAALLVPTQDGTAVADAYLTWSTHAAPQAAHDPYLILDRARTGDALIPRVADARRALWRELNALLLKTPPADARRPRALDDLGSVDGGVLARVGVRAYGFDQDGQQRDATWFEATTPPVLGWLEEQDTAMALHVARCHQAAELIGDKLDFAARLAWKLSCDPPADPAEKVKLDAKKPGPWARRAMTAYWERAEEVFWDLTRPEQADQAPHRAFAAVALDSLDLALGTARADLRTARARQRARAVIRNAAASPTYSAASAATPA